MSDINKRAGEEECGDGRKRGKRGHRGHDGAPGPTGPTGPSNGPTGPTGPMGPGSATVAASSGLPIIAAAQVNGQPGQPAGDGFFSNNGFAGYLRAGPGQYQLALAEAPPDVNCVVTATLNTFFTVAVNIVTGVVGGIVFVQIYAGATQSGNPVFQDARFSVVVTNNQ